jgi:predicted MFS family arabinose efflux permease
LGLTGGKPKSTKNFRLLPFAAMARPLSERKLLFLLGAVQFINVMDFMMVMPLGPDFAGALGIPTDRLGLVAGSYTAAAALAGMIGTLFLDRFDRRNALFVAMLGLVCGTAAGGLATGLPSMLGARVVAGAFGGPATSLALSILTDAVPPARRGKALGAVMGAFAAASVLGVPAGLELARLGGWRTPFFAVAGLGLIQVTAVVSLMPPMRGHIREFGQRLPVRSLGAFLTDRTVLLSLLATAVTMIGSFALIVNLSAFLQFNLGYPRGRLGFLYMTGGLVSFFSMRLAGRTVDRRGSVTVAIAGSALIAVVIGLTFLPAQPWIPAVALFVGFMMGNSTRMVALNALTMRVPGPGERARFMSAQSAVQHISTSIGATGSALFLREQPDHSLVGMRTLAVGAILLSVVLPFLVSAIAAGVRVATQTADATATGMVADVAQSADQIRNVAGSPRG